MRRVLAAILCCFLFWSAPMALAAELEEPDAGETPAETDALTETQTPEENAGETIEEESPGEAALSGEPDLSALESETAIHTMEVTVTLDKNGRAVVSEKLEMVVVGTAEKLRFSFPAEASHTSVDGFRSSSDKENGLQYRTVSSKSGFTGSQTFTLSYTMSGLVSGGEASQVLRLPLLSLQDYRIGRLTFTVILPEEFASQPRFSSGYYGDLVEDLILYNTGTVSLAGFVNEIMRDNDTLTMTLTLPEGYFNGRYQESSLGTVMTVLALVFLALAVAYWLRTLRNPPLRVQARTLPPDGVNPGDIPFLLAGGSSDFNMLVTHWAVLGYLSFYVSKSGHVLLRRRMSMGNERRPFERRLFDLLFGDGDICDGASLRYKRVGEKAMQVVPRYWSRRLYEKRSGSTLLARLLCGLSCAFAAVVAMDAVAPDKLHGLFLLISFVAGFAMCWLIFQACGAWYLNDWLWSGVGIGCGLLLLIVGGTGGATAVMLPVTAVTVLIGWQTCHGGLRRPYGDEVIAQTLGFRRFLSHATEQNMMQMQRRDPQYFYKLLPYAEAMGLGRKFVTLFQDCRLESCQWYESARGNPVTAAAFYDHYADTMDMLNLSIRK